MKKSELIFFLKADCFPASSTAACLQGPGGCVYLLMFLLMLGFTRAETHRQPGSSNQLNQKRVLFTFEVKYTNQLLQPNHPLLERCPVRWLGANRHPGAENFFLKFFSALFAYEPKMYHKVFINSKFIYYIL